MCKQASVQLEYINKEIKKVILGKISIPGKCDTAISGLTFLCEYESDKKAIPFCKPSIAVIIQGTACTIIEKKKYYCEEKHYFFTFPYIESCSPVNSSGERPFLALFLTLEARILSQLVREISEFSKRKNKEIQHNIIISDMDIDLFNCFLRLVGLLDKPEQIHIRAPIIIREIHYLLLISPLGKKLKHLSRCAPYAGKKFHNPLQLKTSILSVHSLSSNFHSRSILKIWDHYGSIKT